MRQKKAVAKNITSAIQVYSYGNVAAKTTEIAVINDFNEKATIHRLIYFDSPSRPGSTQGFLQTVDKRLAICKNNQPDRNPPIAAATNAK